MPSAAFFNHEAGKKIADTFGYSQVAKLPNGAVILAGMLGVDETMAIKPTLDEQVDAILSHIEAALAMVGAKPSDIYKVTSYHLSLASAGSISAAWATRYGTKPTWTAIGVTELGVPHAQLEVQVEAWPSL